MIDWDNIFKVFKIQNINVVFQVQFRGEKGVYLMFLRQKVRKTSD